jgi:hypothetical protein
MITDVTEQQLKSAIGRLEATIEGMEDCLDEREFQDYCDHVYSCISYHRQALAKLHKLEE